jgi:trimeric autotransporter adhesin
MSLIADETRALAEAAVTILPVTTAVTPATTAAAITGAATNSSADAKSATSSTTTDTSKLTRLKLSVKTVETFKQNISKRQHRHSAAATATDQLTTAELLRMSAKATHTVTRSSSGYDQHGVYSGSNDSDCENNSDNDDDNNDGVQQHSNSSNSVQSSVQSSVHSRHTGSQQQQQQQHASSASNNSSAVASKSSSSSSLTLSNTSSTQHSGTNDTADAVVLPLIAVADSTGSTKHITADSVTAVPPANATTANSITKSVWSWPIRRRKRQ